MFTLRDLLDYAIRQEQNSQTLYQRGAEKVTDEKTRQFMRKLGQEEIEHEKMLVSIKESGLYDLATSFEDKRLLELTALSHGSNSFEFNESWSIDGILHIALIREFTARSVYEAAIQVAPNPELKTLFRNLSEMEAEHHHDVDKYYKMHQGLMGDEF
jgi:rubrerythrin